jgi:surface polysaccharide O-acyltransferase-like enzyme
LTHTRPAERRPRSFPEGGVGRVASLDTGRVVAVLAVLMLHARIRRQFHGGDLSGWERVLEVAADHACRFAVPFFFFVSGYLLARSTRGGSVLPRAAAGFRRVVVLYLVWSVLFLAVDPFEWAAYEVLTVGHVSGPVLVWPPPGDLILKVFQGARIQLWFLPALGTALLVVGLLDRARPAVGLTVAIALYVIGLAIGTYGGVTGLGLGPISRNGPFFSTLFVFLGFRAGRADGRPALGPAVLLVALGAAAQGFEAWALHEYAGTRWINDGADYFVGTALMGLGAGRLALARPDFGAGTVGPRLGALTLGVYLLHMDVQYLFSALWPPFTLAGQFGLVVFSYVISVALTWLIARTRLGKRLVT